MTTPASPAAGTDPHAGHADVRHASSPESLDNAIVTTKPRAWWALWAITAAVVLGLVWSLVAVIPLQKTATGVVSPYVYSRIVAATAAGIYNGAAPPSKDDTNWNAHVSQGEVLGTIEAFDGSGSVNVTSPVEGSITSIFASQGAGVEPGTPLLEVAIAPTKETGLAVVAWVPESTAYSIQDGGSADVQITDTTSGETFVVEATVNEIAETPSSEESMITISGSEQLASQWMEQAGGAPYRLSLSFNLDTWPSQYALPSPGSVVSIVDTYDQMHPIQLLFGGA